MRYTILFFLVCLFSVSLTAQNHWSVTEPNKITLDLSKPYNDEYADNIEMAGKRVAGIITYEIDKNKQLKIEREVFFPQLRTYLKTNDPDWKQYRAYLTENYSDAILPNLTINKKVYTPGKVLTVNINGILTFKHEAVEGITLERSFFPSMSERLFVEQWTFKNITNTPVILYGNSTSILKKVKGVKGNYETRVSTNLKNKITITPGETYSFSIGISATLNNEKHPNIQENEFYQERLDFLNKMKSSLILETPNKTINTLFEFSKIRGSESIFESKLGLIHSPGGGRYYVGFWANDQAEYINPFFPYLGYKTGNDAAMNMFEVYTKAIPENFKNIRYSFEMEGDAPINPLDRGDAAMIAYGAAQFALASGDKNKAESLWKLITWCLEYNRRQLNSEGVVASESDEMEGRISTGNANLSTSSLYYGALNLAYDLGKSLGKSNRELNKYKRQAQKLYANIENYFGFKIDGLNTYKYYKEHRYLRHWICLPLVVGINTRKDDTIKALFEKLWSENGLHVENNDENLDISKIFWDRATLYALRGTFLAGATEPSLEKLKNFSEKRLLGDRVPYVVEAFPEGNMAHLSAESGLYCRVITEGMFGIIPTGLKSFKFTPRLPKEWNEMSLNRIKAFGEDFSIEVKRVNQNLVIKILKSDKSIFLKKKIKEGKTINVNFNN
ncbi:six-hairpin glycosidase-like protein [Aureibaculum marinum]|uniref:Six-hairpin glycosidase-like protein n=1 Tax=Aureibaculum marinum TaxID=2487930 RepID=A0A3N4NVX0_9FLAO|nr:six-hairpin glycosidase-like protein [Aureibaculum marinum]RPD99975.1 six-hairpin glycosidase-like protein [Aureibaculum marinum]